MKFHFEGVFFDLSKFCIPRSKRFLIEQHDQYVTVRLNDSLNVARQSMRENVLDKMKEKFTFGSHEIYHSGMLRGV